MADYPALPLWTDAYLADTRHLTTEEHGAYLLLLIEAWRRPGCSLPDDDGLLARLAGLPADRWEQVKPVLMELWKRDGRRKTWTQKRLSKERAFVVKNSKSQSDKAAKRWNKTKNTDAAALPNVCPEDAPTPTPTPTVEVEVLRPSTSKEEEARARGLLKDVMVALGHDPGTGGRYWRGKMAVAHVIDWLALGLAPAEIVEIARDSRVSHPTPPDGPKALDREMEAFAAAKASGGARKSRQKPMAEKVDREATQAAMDARLSDWIKRGTCPPSIVSMEGARRLLASKLASEADLRRCSIKW